MVSFPIGSVHGRFQILHNEHMAYITEAKRYCDHLVVGITNVVGLTDRTQNTEGSRRSEINNPLTYFERSQMISQALISSGISAEEFSCSPFPIEQPDNLPYFLDLKAVCFTTIREAWNITKIDELRKAGYQVVVLLEGREKIISGSKIRDDIIAKGQSWRALVPNSVADYLTNLDIYSRLDKIMK